MKIYLKGAILGLSLATSASGYQSSKSETPGGETKQVAQLDALDRQFETILSDFRIETAGVAIIRNGQIAWTGYYGEQAPGVPASKTTMFNTASLAKTIASEVIVRLADQSVLSLDEPMAPHWVDPDLIEDPRHAALTARSVLTHRTGLPNWRYSDPEFKLKFLRDPNTAYGYSGEGFEYVAKFAQNKLKRTFPSLAQELVFDPLNLSGISIAPQPWVRDRIVHPVGEDGRRRKPFCTDAQEWRCAPDGEWSAADELATTVEDYASFLVSVMNGEGLSEALHKERFEIQTSTAQDPILKCRPETKAPCPRAQGYGLGWEIFEFDGSTLVSHSGGDWSERSVAYFDPQTRDGVVVFLNGPGSSNTPALIAAMKTVDPGSRMAVLFESWVSRPTPDAEAGDGS